MNGKLLLILYVFLLNVKLSKQDKCSYGGYSMDEPTEEKCLSFSYQFNNSICIWKNNSGTIICNNITETELETESNGKYSLTNITNNCGFSGFFEPTSTTSCREVNLVEGRCCYVNYTISGEETKIRKSCLRTNKYKKKDKSPEDINNLFTQHYAYASLRGAYCKESNIKMKYNLIFLFLIFLI